MVEKQSVTFCAFAYQQPHGHFLILEVALTPTLSSFFNSEHSWVGGGKPKILFLFFSKCLVFDSFGFKEQKSDLTSPLP